MTPIDSSAARWRKSSYSGIGNCVEIARANRLAGVRDSKDIGGAVLVFGAHSFQRFIAGAKAGEFDLPADGGCS